MKNNAPAQVRIPEFQSSSSRRLRIEMNPKNHFTQQVTSDTTQKELDGIEKQHHNRLEKKREWTLLCRMNETDDQRQ